MVLLDQNNPNECVIIVKAVSRAIGKLARFNLIRELIYVDAANLL